jgi:hypothetical protein
LTSDLGAARLPPAAREGEDPVERGSRVREVGLQRDAGGQPGELLLREDRGEDLDRDVEVPVLLHVEVDEDRRVTGERRPVDRAQSLGDPGDGPLGVPGRDLRDQGGHLHRDVLDVGARDELDHPARAVGGLLLAEHGLAEKVEVESFAGVAGLVQPLGQGLVRVVDDEVPDQRPQAPAGQGDDEARGEASYAGAQREQEAVDAAEEARVGPTHVAQLPGRHAQVLRPCHAVDEPHGQVEAGRVGEHRRQPAGGRPLGRGEV